MLNRFMEYENNIHFARANIGENFQNEFYKPEMKNTFVVSSYWIHTDNLHYFYTNSLLCNYFIKKDKALFLIHPECEDFYGPIKLQEKGPFFHARATSSCRTLLMYPDDNPNLLFFGKLSINKIIDYCTRTIPLGEVSRSVGTTIFLDDLKKKDALPENFDYFREVIGMIPKNFDRGGMIIREVHPKLLTSNIMPFFALFTKQKDNEYPILRNYNKSFYINKKHYVKKKIIRPFIKQFIALSKLGIAMECHAQNVLIEVENGTIKCFIYRDFGGFNINLKTVPIHLKMPYVSDILIEYHQDKRETIFRNSLDYFDHNILFEIYKIFNLDSKDIYDLKIIKKYLKKYKFSDKYV